MELQRDLWHLAFVYLVTHNAPPNFEVLSEVRLNIEPQRADMILLRRKDAERRDEQATVLRRLWPWLGRVTVLEYKSPVNYAFKPGDLLRLWVYGALYELSHLDELPNRSELTLVLVVAAVTPTLRNELERLSAKLVKLEEGYARIDGLGYTCFVAIIDDVCEAERDEYLRLFSHHKEMSAKAALWIKQWMKESKMKEPSVEELQEAEDWFQEIIQRMPIEKRLAGLDPQQRLAGLDPQQRLAGLDAEEIVAASPIEVLKLLPDDYIRTFAPDIQQKIRQRLRNETH
jgi:hypothetical protein